MYINNAKLTFDIKSYPEQKPKCLKLAESYPEKKTNILIVLLVPCILLNWPNNLIYTTALG